MLKIKNLSIVSRKPIINDFSYQFELGNLYGLVAINGAGKTTFFRTVTGLLPFKNGDIKINGKKISQSKRDVFYFELSEWLDKNLSGKDYLEFVKKAWKSQKKIEEIVNYWDMSDYIHLPIKKYSLGMKQRLIIAMYVVSDAKCLLMDEITSGLDENSRKKLFKQLNKLVKEENKMVIISSHYKEDIISECDYCMSLASNTMEVHPNGLLKISVEGDFEKQV